MKKHVLIFYAITTVLLFLIVGFQDSMLLPYIEVAYVLFTFAESYYVLQNYDFDHGIPFTATLVKLSNTMIVLFYPIVGLLIHLVIHGYLYNHIRRRASRDTRLKYNYTLNNVIAGPFILLLFAAFMPVYLFTPLAILALARSYQKLSLVNAKQYIKYMILVSILSFALEFTIISYVAFLPFMIMLIIFEFIEIEKLNV